MQQALKQNDKLKIFKRDKKATIYHKERYEIPNHSSLRGNYSKDFLSVQFAYKESTNRCLKSVDHWDNGYRYGQWLYMHKILFPY